jgi:hypothetical protein
MQPSQSEAHWRLKLSGTLLPHGRVLAAVALLLMFLPVADSPNGRGGSKNRHRILTRKTDGRTH